MSHNALHMFHLTALPPLHLIYDMCSTTNWPNQLPLKKTHTYLQKMEAKLCESLTYLPTYLAYQLTEVCAKVASPSKNDMERRQQYTESRQH